MVSLLNGLSQLGQGVATFAGTAGLEAQRADLQRQSVMLANDLATTREHIGRVEAGDIAAKAAEQGNKYALEQGKQTGGFLVQAHQISADASRFATMHPAETVLLERLGVIPPSGGMSPSDGSGGGKSLAPPLAQPVAPLSDTGVGTQSGDVGTAPSSPTDVTPPSGAAPPPSPSKTSPKSADDAASLRNEIIRKALGLAQPGSEAYNRMAIATGVESDPKFKNATPAEKAAETMMRIAVNEGKMTDPVSRHLMAVAIAGYQMAPISQFGETKPGGPETMAEVIKINPDYQEAFYPERQAAMAKFGGGTEGDRVRSQNVLVQHFEVLEDAIKKLNSGGFVPTNRVVNYFKEVWGVPPPTTLAGVTEIVAEEVQRAITGSIGALADRQAIINSLDKSRGVEPLMDMVDKYRSLAVGQLRGLKKQYEDSTHFVDGPFAFNNKLFPETAARLEGGAAQPDAIAPASPTSAPVDQTQYGNNLRGRGREAPAATAAPAAGQTSPPPQAAIDFLRSNAKNPDGTINNNVLFQFRNKYSVDPSQYLGQ